MTNADSENRHDSEEFKRFEDSYTYFGSKQSSSRVLCGINSTVPECELLGQRQLNRP